MKKPVFKISAFAALMMLLVIGSNSTYVQAASSANTLTHCDWKSFGCTNPPPKATSPTVTPKPANQINGKAQPQAIAPVRPQALIGMPNVAKAGCERFSSPGECWTNCKTEEEITICDVISLDTFMPESPGSGQYVMKIYSGSKVAKGRVMVNKK